MAYQKATTITAWSFSRYSVYKLCPAKAKYLFIEKIKEPSSPALERGAAIHKLAEQYIKSEIARLPEELKLFKNEFTAFRKQYKKKINGMVVEDSWSFTKTWTETTWNDWTGCWLRLKLDCAHHLEEDVLQVTDWKTGKFRPELNDEYMEQLELYALTALILHPHLKEVHPRLAYVDQGLFYPDAPLIYKKENIPALKKTWEKRVAPMLKDKRFAPRPNDKCRWCHFSKSKNGPCKF